jgi:hypothetical protein
VKIINSTRLISEHWMQKTLRIPSDRFHAPLVILTDLPRLAPKTLLSPWGLTHLHDILARILMSVGLLDQGHLPLYHLPRVRSCFQSSFRSKILPWTIPLWMQLLVHPDRRQYHQGIKALRAPYLGASDSLFSRMATVTRLLRVPEAFRQQLRIQLNLCQSKKSPQFVSVMVVPRCLHAGLMLATHHYLALLRVSPRDEFLLN